MNFFDRVLFTDGREWACSQAHGDVLEIAIGTGRNLEHYSADTNLAGIELSEEMLSTARARAAQVGIDVDLHQGDAQFAGPSRLGLRGLSLCMEAVAQTRTEAAAGAEVGPI